MKAQTIRVSLIDVESDPRTQVIQVEIFDDHACWCEVCNTVEQLRWFLRGLRVCLATVGETLVPGVVFNFTEDSVIHSFDEVLVRVDSPLALGR